MIRDRFFLNELCNVINYACYYYQKRELTRALQLTANKKQFSRRVFLKFIDKLISLTSRK